MSVMSCMCAQMPENDARYGTFLRLREGATADPAAFLSLLRLYGEELDGVLLAREARVKEVREACARCEVAMSEGKSLNEKIAQLQTLRVAPLLSEEAAVANALYIGYASPNSLVIENEEYLDEMGEYAIELLYGVSPEEINASYEEKYETTSYRMFSSEIQAHINTLWESLKTENSTEPWIHVTTALIVGGVLAFWGYNFYIKKKRSRDYRLRDKAARKAKAAKSQ